jgi:AraC-like DNA-binding protein
MPPFSDHRIDLPPRCLAGFEAIAISSARSFPRHSHDQFGIGVMRAGGHASWSGCGPVEAGPGDVIAVNPNEMHDGAPIGGARSWEIVFIEPSAVARMVGRDLAAREIGFAARSAPPVAASVGRVLRALWEGAAAEAEETLTALLSDLLSPAPPGTDRTPSPATLRVLARIRDRPDAPPSLDEVAVLMGMGRTGALRRFRREVGATPHEHAMQARLRLARRALAAGGNPAAIAVDLGFADQSHLTRAFARQFGLPPGRYRRVGAKIVQDGDNAPGA